MKEINQQLITGLFSNPINLFMLVFELGVIIILFRIIKPLFHKNIVIRNSTSCNTVYQKKKLMTDAEYHFYLKLKSLESKYRIIPQLNLATITTKLNNKYYYTDLFRNIDFAIFSDDFSEILLLIELNDATHNLKRRKMRDLKVEKICNEIGVPLMKFYTKYPNEEDYVLKRILKELEKPKNDIVSS